MTDLAINSALIIVCAFLLIEIIRGGKDGL